MVDELKSEFRARTFGYISAALGLVAGLAWNEAIKSMIEAIFPLAQETIFVKFLYAILVTTMVIILIRYLDKLVNKS